MRKIDVLKNATLEETAEWLTKVTMSSVMAGATDDEEFVREFMSIMSSQTARLMFGKEQEYNKLVKQMKELLESEAEEDKLSLKWFVEGCEEFEI